MTLIGQHDPNGGSRVADPATLETWSLMVFPGWLIQPPWKQQAKTRVADPATLETAVFCWGRKNKTKTKSPVKEQGPQPPGNPLRTAVDK